MGSVAPTTRGASTNLLLVSQPHTPGLSPIPGTTEETREIQDLLTTDSARGFTIRCSLLEGAEATVVRVKDELKSHAWVHFACHAVQLADSLRSGLHLHDRRLELLEIMQQRDEEQNGTSCMDTSVVPEPAFAFLSACQTGAGDNKLPDEVVHVAAGMLAAGFTSVVATMWSIKDEYGKAIAVSFYKHLLDLDPSDSLAVDSNVKKGVIVSRAAWALNRAVREIRMGSKDIEQGLLAWVPYIHYGI